MKRLEITQPKIVPKIWGKEIWTHNSPEYCGKILEFKAGGKFSNHFHVEKHETWYVISGAFILRGIDGDNAEKYQLILKEGDIIDVKRGYTHQLECFSGGGSIMEVSTEHKDEDSYRIEPGDSQVKNGKQEPDSVKCDRELAYKIQLRGRKD